MREYKLADSAYRKNVNLKKYKNEILDIVNKIAPHAEVEVKRDRYIIKNRISKGQAIQIGREIAKSRLGIYSMKRPILFRGEDV